MVCYPSTNTHIKWSGAEALVTADPHTHFVLPKCVCVKADGKQTPGGQLIHHCQHVAKQLQNISVNIAVCVCGCTWVCVCACGCYLYNVKDDILVETVQDALCDTVVAPRPMDQ